MKICFINNRFSAHIRGGAERTIQALIAYLNEVGHEITVIEANQNYARLASLPKWRRFIYHSSSFLDLASFSRLRRKIKRGNFDIIWTHNLTGFGLLAFRALGNAKKIHTMHDIQLLHPSGLMMYGAEKSIDTFIAKIYQFIVKLFFPKDALVIFPSEWLKTLYSERGFFKHNKCILLKNPLEKTVVKTTASELFTFLYLGQVEEHKGVEMLLKAFRKISLPCSLVIGGDGTILERLKRQYRDSRITFLGGFENPYTYLAKASCAVIPSICYENLPTVALEAARAETPVIGSNTGGVKESIGVPQLLFEPRAEDLQDLMLWVLTNPEELKKLSAEGRARLAIPTTKEYWEKVSKEII